MIHPLQAIVRCLAGLGACVLLYSSVFLYKAEEGRLENRMQQWWRRIRKLHTSALSIEAAFLKVIADVTANAFSHVFGERLLGPTAIAASINFSMTGVFLSYSIVSYKDSTKEAGLIAFLGLIFFAFAWLGRLFRGARAWIWVGFVAIAAVCPFFVKYFENFHDLIFSSMFKNAAIGAVYMLPLGVVCDFLFLILTRWMLKSMGDSNSFKQILLLLLGNTILGAALVLLPLLAALRTDDERLSYTLSMTAASNSLDAIIASIYIFIAVLMLLHRAMWPLFERPLYALHRYRFFSSQKKLCFSSGIALMCLAMPQSAEILKKFAESLHV